MRHVVVLVVALVLSTLGSSPAMAQGKMTMLPLSFLGGLSADGRIAVGVYTSGRAWRWEEGRGGQDLHGQDDINIPGCGGVSISRDGQTIVGCLEVNGLLGAGIWQGGQNWRDIGNLGGRSSSFIVTDAKAVSGDGSIIVGGSYNPEEKYRAFRWTQIEGMVDLGAMTDEGSSGFSRVNGISPDGKVLVGWDQNVEMQDFYSRQSRRGAIWWDGAERLIHPFGWAGEAVVTNDVGSVIAGYGHPASDRTAWIFSIWNGQLYDLGALRIGTGEDEPNPTFYTSYPTAMSDDGRVVVGYSGAPPLNFAFIWTPETGMMYLLDYLKANNVPGAEDWVRLGIATAVTPDGKTIGGSGVYEGVLGDPSFIVTLP